MRLGAAEQAVSITRAADNSDRGDMSGQCTSSPGTLPVMQTSAAWINDYLDRPVDADTQAEILTHAGFPLEERLDVDGDVRQDYEMTSNRGDCMCHIGLAREIAAVNGGVLQMPKAEAVPEGDATASYIAIHNEEIERCPLYTGRVIRGVTVGPSCDFISSRLQARGDVPRSNIVDATNFVLFELGQPTHVFDLDTIAGGEIHIRMARKGERFLPLGEDAQEIELNGTELVIADAEKPVALAGVKGGALTAVTDATRNVLIEAATFDPVAVRHTSRLHSIASDSSVRFERGVSPGQVDAAAERLAQVILSSAGGTLASGVVRAGGAMPERLKVTMRTQRCRDLLGLDISDDFQTDMLGRLGFEPHFTDGTVMATVPWHRGDITREIDLIEEVMRMYGFVNVPVEPSLHITPVGDSVEHLHTEAMTACLVGAGFVESVTHTLIGHAEAEPFSTAEDELMHVDVARGLGEPVLRPSILPSLLRVRGHNADRGVGPLQLFEFGSSFAHVDGHDQEHLELGLLMDVTNEAHGVRPIRGVIDRLIELLAGPDANVEVTDTAPPTWLSPGGTIMVDTRPLGHFGVLSTSAAKACGLSNGRWLAAALRPIHWINLQTPPRQAHRLPDLPAIERDLSAIVGEGTPWKHLQQIVSAQSLSWLEDIEFVTVWRGKGVPDEHKSVTMRLRFRASDRTLTRDDVEPLMQQAIDSLRSQANAEIRQ